MQVEYRRNIKTNRVIKLTLLALTFEEEVMLGAMLEASAVDPEKSRWTVEATRKGTNGIRITLNGPIEKHP